MASGLFSSGALLEGSSPAESATGTSPGGYGWMLWDGHEGHQAPGICLAMERSTIFNRSTPSISMGHLYHGYVTNNQRVLPSTV